ncbi:MAG TPA: SRPBCC domain-containing protein, partial [Methylomirabilota bacterium]|nr:SRPBCC domain-containing protein [Methylomirabilota bacterium]
MDVVEREVMVPAPPAEVWPALIDSDEVSAWFGAEAEIDARPGGRGVFRWSDGTERPVLVEEVEPGRRLAFRWLPFQRTADGEVVSLPATRVEITLDEVAGGTLVRVVER